MCAELYVLSGCAETKGSHPSGARASRSGEQRDIVGWQRSLRTPRFRKAGTRRRPAQHAQHRGAAAAAESKARNGPCPGSATGQHYRQHCLQHYRQQYRAASHRQHRQHYRQPPPAARCWKGRSRSALLLPPPPGAGSAERRAGLGWAGLGRAARCSARSDREEGEAPLASAAARPAPLAAAARRQPRPAEDGRLAELRGQPDVRWLLPGGRHCGLLRRQVRLGGHGRRHLPEHHASRNRYDCREGPGGLLHQRPDPRCKEVLCDQRQPLRGWGLHDGHPDEEPRRGADVQRGRGQSWSSLGLCNGQRRGPWRRIE